MAPRPKPLEVTLIQALVQVADTGSITTAARALSYSQPGLSQRVQTLERVLGCRLFDRRSTGMHLTGKGTAVLPYARMLLTIADAMHDEAARPTPDDAHPTDPEDPTPPAEEPI